jgi:hypothetical protein
MSENEKPTVFCLVGRQNRILSLHPAEDSWAAAHIAQKLYNVTRPEGDYAFVVAIHPDWEAEGKVGEVWRGAMAIPKKEGQKLEQHLKP